jgi:hypothetical protein
VWFLWENHAFWILTGPWARQACLVQAAPAIALVADGPDETRWDQRFRQYLHGDPAEKGTVWLRLRPASLTAGDYSYII